MRILTPSVEFASQGHVLAPRPATLNGKVVAFTDAFGSPQPDGSVKKSAMMMELKKLLEERFHLAGTLWFIKSNVLDPLLPEVLREIEAGADAVINGECWGSETVAGVRDAVTLEKLGKPTITLGYESVRPFFVSIATAEGMPDLPFFGERQPLVGNVPDQVEAIARAGIEHVVRSLTSLKG